MVTYFLQYHVHDRVEQSQKEPVSTKSNDPSTSACFIFVNHPKMVEQQAIHVAHGHLLPAIPCSRSSCVVPKMVSFNQKQRPITVSTSHLWQTSRNVRNNSYTWRMVTYRLQIHVERSSFVVPRRTGFNQKQRPINVSTISFVANIPKR